jgi:hypothetical protein
MSPRQSTSILVAASVLAAGAIAYFAFFSGGPNGSSDTIAPAQAARTTADGGAPRAVDDGPRDPGELIPETSAPERVDVALEGRQAEVELAEADKQYVEGRVVLGFALPTDEELYVLSLDGPQSAESLYGKRGAVEAVWDPGAERKHLLDFAPVGTDGGFRVALPKTSDVAHLALAGRYVYSRQSMRVDLPARVGAIVLSGELGGWITGVLEAPRSQGEDVSLARVEVELEPDITAAFNAMEIGSFAYSSETETDAAGRFEFRSVSNALTHGVIVRHEHLASQLILGIKPGPGEHLQLAVDMQRGATLRGRILNEAGAGLAGAEVSVTLPGPLGKVLEELRSTKTDPSGGFELKNVLTGRLVQVNASLEGHRPGKLKLEEKLRDGQLLDGLRLLLSEGAVVAGRVLYPDGLPATGASVGLAGDLSRTDVAMMGARLGELGNAEAETDEEGRFELRGLQEGPYRLSVSVEPKEGPHAGSWRARAKGVLGGDRDVLLELEGLTVLAGRVSTESEREIGKFSLHLVMKGSGGVMGVGAERLQESFENKGDGSFTKAGVPPGLWEVRVQAEGFALSALQEIAVPQVPGAPLPEFSLVPAANIAGTVFDSFNKPVSGAKVSLELDLASRINSAFTGESPSAFSDHEGKYFLANLDPGAHSIVASLQGFAGSEPRAVDLAAAQTASEVDLALRVGGTLSGQVLGDDGDPAVGRMVIVQRVPTYSSQHMLSSNSNGEFRVEHLEPGQWQVVSTPNFMTGELDMEGGGDVGDMLSDLKMDMVDIIDGEETFVLLGKPPEDPIEVRGSVTHQGAPIARAMISFVPDGTQGLADLKIATTNEEGDFNLQLEKRGSYLVTVQNNVSTGRQNSIEFRERIPEEGETYRLRLELPVAGITGRVLDVDGRPAANCRVTLNVDGGIAYGSIMGGHYTEIVTEDDGTYEIKYLRPGTYTVSAGGATMSGLFGNDSIVGRVVRDNVRVTEGQWLTGIDFKLESPGSLTGTVRGLDNQPVVGAAVFVRDAKGRLLERFSMVATDGAGKFTYHCVAAGDYTISAKNEGSVSPQSAPVKVVAGQTAQVDVTLEEGTTFLVSVVDKDDEEIRARISVVDEAGNEMCGMLSLDEIMEHFGRGISSKEQRVGPLPAGKYRVEALMDDGRTTKKTISVSGQSERKIKLRI